MAGQTPSAPDLGGLGVIPGDRQAPLNRGRTRRMPFRVEAGQPLAHRSSAERDRGGGHGPSVGRVDVAGEVIEQCRFVTSQVGLAGDHDSHVAFGDRVDERHQFVADAVSAMGRIDV